MPTGRQIIVAGMMLVLSVVVLGALRAFVISMLWGWFVVPAFGLPPISVVVAFGMGMLVSTFTFRGATETEGKQQDWAELFGKAIGIVAGGIGVYAFTLGLGWILHFYV